MTVVNNNSGMTQETGGITRAFRGSPPEGAFSLMNFNRVNLAKLAEDMGCFGVRVERPEEIRQALHAALAAGRPALVDVATDPAVLPPPPWVP